MQSQVLMYNYTCSYKHNYELNLEAVITQIVWQANQRNCKYTSLLQELEYWTWKLNWKLREMCIAFPGLPMNFYCICGKITACTLGLEMRWTFTDHMYFSNAKLRTSECLSGSGPCWRQLYSPLCTLHCRKQFPNFHQGLFSPKSISALLLVLKCVI